MKNLNDQELTDYIQQVEAYLTELKAELDRNPGGDHPIQPPPKP